MGANTTRIGALLSAAMMVLTLVREYISRRGNLKKLLLILAVSMAIGLGVSVASAATRCKPVLTPGENLARVAARCPPSTTFIIKDGTYKLSRAVIANSGDTFKGLYSDKTRPKIDANGAPMAFNVGDTTEQRAHRSDDRSIAREGHKQLAFTPQSWAATSA
jgi:hypothetical protein